MAAGQYPKGQNIYCAMVPESQDAKIEQKRGLSSDIVVNKIILKLDITDCNINNVK